jgi:hypothetical protein
MLHLARTAAVSFALLALSAEKVAARPVYLGCDVENDWRVDTTIGGMSNPRISVPKAGETCVVEGFPTEYELNKQYNIQVPPPLSLSLFPPIFFG